ncbi:MAG: helix-turn-helix transcriptional regulator [Bacteroidales bacterium]|nr:helix-turn-helix transcriptional regulator [Bacteroidales bacterium]
MVTITISTVITLFSFTIYFSVKPMVTRFEKQKNSETMSAIQVTVGSILTSMKEFSLSIYKSDEMYTLMQNKSSASSYDVAESLRKLEDLFISQEKVHSIGIFFPETEVMLNTHQYMYYNDTVLHTLIDKHTLPIGKLFGRSFHPLEANTDDSTLLTIAFDYLEYSPILKRPIMFVNFHIDWISEIVNTLEKSSTSRYILLSNNDDFVLPLDEDEEHLILFQEYLKNYSQELPRQGKIHQGWIKLNNKRWLVSSMTFNRSTLVLVGLKSYGDVFQNWKNTQIVILVISFGMLIVSALIGMLISYLLYRPIQHLTDHFTANRRTESWDESEIEMLKNIYDTAQSEYQEYRSAHMDNEDILVEYQLKKMLMGVFDESENDWVKLSEEVVGIDLTQSLRLVYLEVVNNKAEINSVSFLNLNSEDIILDAVPLMATQMLGSFRSIQMNENEFYLLGNSNETYPVFSEKLDNIINSIGHQSGITVKALYYPFLIKRDELHKTFQILRKKRDLIFLIPDGSSVSVMKFTSYNKNSYQGFSKLIEDILLAIRGGKVLLVDKLIDKGTDFVATAYPDLARSHLQEMFRQILSTLSEIEQNNSGELTDWLKDRSEIISNPIIDIFTFRNQLKEMIGDFFLRSEISVDEKHLILIQSVQKYIKNNYRDHNINIEQLAYKFHINSSNLGHLFKQINGIGVNQYVNKLRISKAVEYLITTDMKVKDISYQVGFGTLSYFYRSFKSELAVSPTTYRVMTSCRVSKISETRNLKI